LFQVKQLVLEQGVDEGGFTQPGFACITEKRRLRAKSERFDI
jgi:hypothetical protein